RRPKIKLRPVPREIRRVPPPFFLRQNVRLRLELRVRRDRPRSRQHHPPLHVLLLRPPQQHPDVVPRLPFVQQLLEHLHPRHHPLARLRAQPQTLHLFLHLHLPSLHPSRPHPPPPRDSRLAPRAVSAAGGGSTGA